jgi:hypothetical protein
MNRVSIVILGAFAAIVATWLWHGPLGAGDRFASAVDSRARVMLDHYEMVHVRAQMERKPLTRRVLLSGPADDFQRREIKRMIEAQPGVAEASWSPSSLKSEEVH